MFLQATSRSASGGPLTNWLANPPTNQVRRQYGTRGRKPTQLDHWYIQPPLRLLFQPRTTQVMPAQRHDGRLLYGNTCRRLLRLPVGTLYTDGGTSQATAQRSRGNTYKERTLYGQRISKMPFLMVSGSPPAPAYGRSLNRGSF